MKKFLISLVLLTSTIFAPISWANHASIKSTDFSSVDNPTHSDYGETSQLEFDSLNFVNTKRNKTATLKKGMKIEILTNTKQRIIGEFSSASENNIELKQNKDIVLIAMADIKKILIYNQVSNDPITGSLRFLVGASSVTSLGLGGAAIIGGVATMGTSTLLGVGLFAVSVPLVYYGIKLQSLLKHGERSKIKLNNGWEVMTPQPEQ